MVNETDIVELNVNSKKFKLAVKKKEALEAREPQVVYQAMPGAPGACCQARCQARCRRAGGGGWCGDCESDGWNVLQGAGAGRAGVY